MARRAPIATLYLGRAEPLPPIASEARRAAERAGLPVFVNGEPTPATAAAMGSAPIIDLAERARARRLQWMYVAWCVPLWALVPVYWGRGLWITLALMVPYAVAFNVWNLRQMRAARLRAEAR